MILSDKNIKKSIQSKKIIIESEYWIEDIINNISCASLDVRLWNNFKIFPKSSEVLDLYNKNNIKLKEKYLKDWDFIIIQPWEFLLWTTTERIWIPDNIVARVEWRSSIWRLGILVHSTAWFIDPWFWWDQPSTITLEIKNINTVPVKLKVWSRISQIAFETMSEPAENPYNKKKSAKYNWQIKAQISKLDKDPNQNNEDLLI